MGLIGRQLFPSSQLPASQLAASVVSLQPGGRQSQFWLSPRPLLSLRTLVDVTELESLSACVQGKEGNPFTPKFNTVNRGRHAGRKKKKDRFAKVGETVVLSAQPHSELAEPCFCRGGACGGRNLQGSGTWFLRTQWPRAQPGQ